MKPSVVIETSSFLGAPTFSPLELIWLQLKKKLYEEASTSKKQLPHEEASDGSGIGLRL